MSLSTRTDVTSLKFYKNFILAGIGSFVYIFDKKTTKLVHRTQALNGQKVYGFVISKCGKKIVVFGGKQFTIFNVEPSEPEDIFVRQFKPVVCDDWLHSGVWVDEEHIALLTAHNVVLKWNITNQVLLSNHPSKDNSILYSGLLLPVQDDLLIFAGTVFSEVIIHRCGEDTPLHYLKGHRGVIFSINCEPKKEVIVTTSDDRSLRIWGLTNIANCTNNTRGYWENITIECKYEVYGHSARVMRSLITNNFIVSVGEDSAVCFWSYEGILQRKLVPHQTASIWSVDTDETHLVTGGGDSGIVLQPLTVTTEYGHKFVFDAENNPKHIQFTARNNLVILNEKAQLVYYDVTAQFSMVHKLSHVSSFKLLSMSSCKQLVAITDLYGKLNIFIENCKDAACLRHVLDMHLTIGRVQSMHWAGNRHIVFCNDLGEIAVITAHGVGVDYYADFELPSCKEKSLTAVAINSSENMFIIGDRNGNVHCFKKDHRMPLKTFKRVHGKYGPTSIIFKNNDIITTGRDGSIKYFLLDDNIDRSKYMSCKELEFQWPEKFLDKDENIICGFQERVFVVFNVKNNMKLLEMPCGGGHRCWDAIRYFDKVNDEIEELIRLVYLKNSIIYIHTFQLSKIVSKIVQNGSHSKDINCLKSWKWDIDPSTTFILTGGEDTTLRISSLNSEFFFQDVEIYKQLSNVRTLKVYPINGSKILVISAGGRAQIRITEYKFETQNNKLQLKSEDLANFLIRGTDDERKRNKTLRNNDIDFDPETRIMDVDAIRVAKNKFLIFAGCSDAYLRVFMFDLESGAQFRPITDIKYHQTCILKTIYVPFFDKHFIVTNTSRGLTAFWHINNSEDFSVKAIHSIRLHQCGVNSFSYKIISPVTILIATGGDDNKISLNLLEIQEVAGTKPILAIDVKMTLHLDRLHCSQITGLTLLDGILVSTSIDQRVTVCSWKIDTNGIQCNFLKQVCSDIADIQGMELLEFNKEEKYVKVCVYGKGMEIFKIEIANED